MDESVTLENDHVLGVLERAIEWMEDPSNQERLQMYDHAGFNADEVGAMGWEFFKLLQADLIEQSYHSSNENSEWRLTDIERAKEVVSNTRNFDTEEESTDDAEDPDSADLFADVVGREEPIKWLRRTIERGEQVHHLLHGPPGSGISEIVEDLARLPRARRVVPADGQTDEIRTLLSENPPYLIVEAIEGTVSEGSEVLMTACGEGFISSGTDERIELDTTVIATSRDITAISPESLVDRFMVWEMEAYDREEFQTLCERVLPRDHGVSEDIAQYIAVQVIEELNSTQLRDAERIAALADDRPDVDELIAARG